MNWGELEKIGSAAAMTEQHAVPGRVPTTVIVRSRRRFLARQDSLQTRSSAEKQIELLCRRMPFIRRRDSAHSKSPRQIVSP